MSFGSSPDIVLGKDRKVEVWVVDDDKQTTEFVDVLLSAKECYRVRKYTNPKLFVQDISENGFPPPAAVILDWKMGGMTGGEVVEQLRESEKTKHLPIVVCSSNWDVPHYIKAMPYQDGIWFLRKPFDIDDLANKVEEAINSNGSYGKA